MLPAVQTNQTSRFTTGSRTAPARQANQREHNLALALRTVLLSPEPLTRAGVADQTGLTRTTVSSLIDDLVRGGFLEELPPRVARTGRPAAPLRGRPGRMLGFGVEVHTHQFAYRIVDLTRPVESESCTVDVTGQDPRDVLRQVADFCTPAIEARLAQGSVFAGFGLAIPGMVKPESGTVLESAGLGWTNVDALAMLAEHPGFAQLNSFLLNDADAAAIAEATTRESRGMSTTFMHLSGEFGLGGAIVLDGMVMRGLHGLGGEFGHMMVDSSGEDCPCGSVGCLTSIASRSAMMKAAGFAELTPIEDLITAVRDGQPRAIEAAEAAGRAVGIALSNAINLVGVELVVLGGSLGLLIEQVNPHIREVLDVRVPAARWGTVTIEQSQNSRPSASLGAAIAPLDAAVMRPGRWLAHGVSHV